MIKCGKSCEEEGNELHKIFKTKMDSKTELRADLYLQNKTKSNLLHISSVSISRMLHS